MDMIFIVQKMILVQWFSNLGIHQYHLKDLLKHIASLAPMSDSGIGTEKMCISNKFPGDPNAGRRI